ncbi:hypothetical protein CEXT_204521 [Caerostris extrusa]|uniref:Uncharacterized protein n=1 Tax=Caerostris extrusa TaxID=172846 RepID=A0AAV4PA96_CAEEX|nr:hypothetical protein CEXT_204521 [Caerostris extrusa]
MAILHTGSGRVHRALWHSPYFLESVWALVLATKGPLSTAVPSREERKFFEKAGIDAKVPYHPILENPRHREEHQKSGIKFDRKDFRG